MQTFLIATLSRYVLVSAADAATAEQLARPQLEQMTRVGVKIVAVRLATRAEIELQRFHDRMTSENS